MTNVDTPDEKKYECGGCYSYGALLEFSKAVLDGKAGKVDGPDEIQHNEPQPSSRQPGDGQMPQVAVETLTADRTEL